MLTQFVESAHQKIGGIIKELGNKIIRHSLLLRIMCELSGNHEHSSSDVAPFFMYYVCVSPLLTRQKSLLSSAPFRLGELWHEQTYSTHAQPSLFAAFVPNSIAISSVAIRRRKPE